MLLQRWLLADPDAILTDWQAGDLSGDSQLTGADLCLMKHLLASL
ncbi:hypothetical protein [Ruminococcus sp.]|nr:hypothetical protein [Ruminococcus sp.]MDY4963571.1 hypothetical protein [Ruminococcus callidus]